MSIRSLNKKVLATVICTVAMTVAAQAASAAVLRFDPESVTVTSGNTFSVDIIVDPLGDEISGTDAYLLYDNSLLSYDGFVASDYFPVIVDRDEGEYVYLNGIITDPTDFRDTSGSIGTASFTLLTDGSGVLEFYCDISQPDTSKIVRNDVDATNIIECENLVTMSINGGDVPAQTEPTAVPQPASNTTNTTVVNNGGVKESAQTTTLPESGVFENVAMVAIPGAILLGLGALLKVFL